MNFDSRNKESSFFFFLETIGYYALLLAIVEEYSASQALRLIRKGE